GRAAGVTWREEKRQRSSRQADCRTTAAASPTEALLVEPPEPGDGALEVGARGRREPVAAETGLVVEEERQPGIDVVPAEQPASHLARIGLEGLVRLAQGDEHLAAVGAPAGTALSAEARVGNREPAEIGIERLVLRRARVRVGLGPEVPAECGPVGLRGIADRVERAIPGAVAEE